MLRRYSNCQPRQQFITLQSMYLSRYIWEPSHSHCLCGKAIIILISLPQTHAQNILSVFMALVKSLSTPVQRCYSFQFSAVVWC